MDKACNRNKSIDIYWRAMAENQIQDYIDNADPDWSNFELTLPFGTSVGLLDFSVWVELLEQIAGEFGVHAQIEIINGGCKAIVYNQVEYDYIDFDENPNEAGESVIRDNHSRTAKE